MLSWEKNLNQIIEGNRESMMKMKYLLYFENIFNRKKETLKNHNKKFVCFSHNDFSKLLELKKKR